jgi:ABC-type antimicrobial peptide transport system permease subunit
MALLVLSLPLFNTLTAKNMVIQWSDPFFWLFCLSFIIMTALLAGFYPALYFSSFKPVSVLKGAFRSGKLATGSRKIMVVFQYAVSIILITGTLIVYKQIQFSKDRPVGYERENLITIQMKSGDFYKKFDLLRTELVASGAVTDVSASSSPTTWIAGVADGFNWEGKDPGLQEEFAYIFMTPEYGRTVGWEIKEGRDMSREFSSDSTAVILNEAAVKFMGIQDPLGKQISWGSQKLHVIGVIKDMIMESPYKPVLQAIYMQGFNHVNWINLKLNPQMSAGKSLGMIESVIKRIIPDTPFNYKFMDEEYAVKFYEEERTANFASVFALFAIFISCLGLFGLAAYTAENRTKEIGIRKVNGAKLTEIMTSLNKDFVKWVGIAFLLATPIAWYTMNKWLENFAYKTELSWWIFALAGLLALGIALLTVSWQSWKAATKNPVESLRYE